MKTEFVDVSDTRKSLVIEIPSAVVDAEIERVARDYSRAARIPGFRPGKVPAKLVRQRFRGQILQDVAHGLIPRAVEEALRERGLEPVDQPDIREVFVEEGQPLKFTAVFETVPPIDPGDYHAITLRKPAVDVEPAEIDRALARLQQRAARYEAIENRSAEPGDTVVMDLERRPAVPAGEGGPRQTAGTSDAPEMHRDVAIEIGATANPPGFDEHLAGVVVGDRKTFTIAYPADYAIGELAGTALEYSVAVKAIKRRAVPELDDEFAKDLGDFDSLEKLRERIHQDLLQEAEQEADRQARADLVKQLATRVSFEVPEALLSREIDRRVEDFVRRLIEQQIDPTRANINWEEFRERQRELATDAVRGALVLDEVARREHLSVSDEEVNQEVTRYAERTGRTAAAVRARLDKEGGISHLSAGLRREKAIDFLLSRATIVIA